MSYEGSRVMPNEQRYKEALEKIRDLLDTVTDAYVQESTLCLEDIREIVTEALE